MMPESHPSYSEFASGAAGQAYNQTAFRHFLAIERRRAERSGRPLLLVLVALRGSRVTSRFTNATAAGIFRGLGETVREVDFAGWFREGRIAGAVLTQGSGAASAPARDQVAERVMKSLRAHVPAGQFRNLRVRVVRFEPRTATDRQHAPTALASGH
ncbi:MAG: hypothetical protein ACRD3G_31185 [Vicinamibacterales bacterium]